MMIQIFKYSKTILYWKQFKKKNKFFEIIIFFQEKYWKKIHVLLKIISLYKNSPFFVGIRLFIKDNWHSKTFNEYRCILL